MRHLWFDPGVTTGWALFEDDKPLYMGELEYYQPLFRWLLTGGVLSPEVDIVGFENYRIRPPGMRQGYTPTGDEAWTIRVIGAIEFASFVARGAEGHMAQQEPTIKPSGYGYAGLGKYDPNKKGMHMQDAIAHGAYYYMENYVKTRRTPF